MICHVAVGLNYLTTCPLVELEGMFKNERGETIAPEAIVSHAIVLKAKGYEVLPPCNNHDALGYCNGHAEQ